jgi:hypothetical protein
MKNKFQNWYHRVKLPFWIYRMDRLFVQRDIENLCYKAYLKGRQDAYRE